MEKKCVERYSYCSNHKVRIFKEYQSVMYVHSSEWNWASPNPSLASECAPPPGTKGWGGGHTRVRVRGWGSPNSNDWRKGLALCLLCASQASTPTPMYPNVVSLWTFCKWCRVMGRIISHNTKVRKINDTSKVESTTSVGSIREHNASAPPHL